jgi:CDP-diglyceride synthetase
MMEDLRFVTLLFAPLVLGSLLHGLVTYFGWFRRLRVPIDGGLRLGGEPLFGANKTWRGVVSVAVGTALGYALAAMGSGLTIPELSGVSPALTSLFGFGLGAGAMLGELPNSFVKRRLGWASGTSPRGMVGALSYVVDQVDLVVGCWAVTVMVAPITTSRVLISLVFVFVFHQLITVLDYLAGVRPSLR